MKWGKDALAQLQGGKAPADLNWSATQVVSRIKPAGLEPTALKEVFKLKSDKLPGYAGVENAQGGFTLIKLTRVIEPGTLDETGNRLMHSVSRICWSRNMPRAYLASLKLKTKIDIKREALEKTERSNKKQGGEQVKVKDNFHPLQVDGAE